MCVDMYNYLIVQKDRRCAVKSIKGKRCPEVGTVQIGESKDYLCDSCYKMYEYINKNKNQKNGITEKIKNRFSPT